MNKKLIDLLLCVQRLAFEGGYAPRFQVVVDLRANRFTRFQDTETQDLINEAMRRDLLAKIGQCNYRGTGYILTRAGEDWLTRHMPKKAA